ncbi:MAG TPA: tRNA (guanosine(37)-N1)-methyltransferase TrmD [Actinotalea sp.]
MRVDVLTIFPEYLSPLGLSLVGKARDSGLLDLRVHDLRDWTTDRHRTVDDTPLGGGAGMVMRPDVWGVALDDVTAGALTDVELIIPTPSGDPFTQRTAERLAGRARIVIACGRYEGIDARVAEHYRGLGVQVTELSLGDYVLNGGEVAAMVVVEAVARLLPGVVGNPESLVEESHGSSGLLEYPVYTRPPVWRDLAAPEVLLSGHHARIARWRRDRAIERTAERRPDILRRLDPADLDRHDAEVLRELGWTVSAAGLAEPDEPDVPDVRDVRDVPDVRDVRDVRDVQGGGSAS